MIFEIIFFSLLSIIISLIVLFVQKKTLDFSKYHVKIRGYKVLILMAVIEITAEFMFKKYTDSTFSSILSLNWIIYIGLLYVSLINIKKSYMMLFFLGTVMNFIAIAANGFKMPVYIPDTLLNSEAQKLFLLSGKDLIHSLLTEDTKFKFLCDIFTLQSPYPFPKTISIGDIFLLSGIYAFWQELFLESSVKTLTYKQSMKQQ
ncbi:MAG TPA: DUF5317 domain-containing protein [Tissierellia bacterium]|nr:DUF5317 domain-containing protein [Tissierellia bacterium]